MKGYPQAITPLALSRARGRLLLRRRLLESQELLRPESLVVDLRSGLNEVLQVCPSRFRQLTPNPPPPRPLRTWSRSSSGRQTRSASRPRR